MDAKENSLASQSMLQLATGFRSLCDEFTALAIRHKGLQSELQAAIQNARTARGIANPDATGPGNDVTQSAAPALTFRDLFEDPKIIGGETHNQAWQNIKCAAQQLETGTSEDLTTSKVTSAPRCPFAKDGMPKPETHPQTDNSRNQHTPRSSAPSLQQMDSRQKRASFHDPLRPEVQISRPVSPESSVASGPACPIRFLGQHSPEDIATYFEQHKHELPRSHEICVKRFQTNADSIRELDAKYGSLVTMIQGLGHKHQPMLPTNPNPEDKSGIEEESKSNKKVKSWAKAVSESMPEKAENLGDSDARTRSEGQDEERDGHFDRPLKEIRVGESPSRPWGVPIPSKYLDRTFSNDTEPSNAKALPETREIQASHHDKETVQPLEMQRHVAGASMKGKCPFNHGATQIAPSVAKQDVESPEVPRPTVVGSTMAQGKHTHVQEVDRGTPAEVVNDIENIRQVVNEGTTVVANARHLKGIRFVNRGTLVLGYGDVGAGNIITKMSRIFNEGLQDIG